MRLIRVTKEEYELDDGSIFEIDPPLDYEPILDEFQKLYEQSSNFIRGGQRVGCDYSNFEKLE
jgi:hypothetical protein